MKKYLFAFVCLFIFTSGIVNSYAQEGDEFLNAKIEAMEKQLQDLKEQFQKQQEISKVEKQEFLTLKKDLKGFAPGEGDYWAKKAFELQEKGLAPTFGKQYAKPFLRRFGRNTYVGGYMDHELVFDEGGNDFFDQHRLIPFIYSDVSDRIKFATEIEFEHGGTDGPGGVLGQSGEMKIEFATLDFLINDAINYRGGIILSPLGKYNLVHDSPLQDLAIRPMVNRNIIPTTLSEAGMGFFGTFYPTELSKLDYEIYLVNGFQALQDDGEQATSSAEGFIRSSRGSLKADNNTNFAVVGRLAYSPFLGLEFAGSFHTGTIDERNRNRQTIVALDWTYQKGAFELVGEMAKTMTDRDGTVSTGEEVSDLIAQDSFGYYIEPRYHFMPGLLQDIAPTFFNEFSTFTAVLRFGATDMGNFGYDKGKIRRTRITPGINYRYTEDTVFKAEYLINLEHGRELEEVSNNQLVFSVSTYF
ncbi:MAG: hypothetical protein MRK01_09245 [Candidatus Scalindua sp.]|nr:hypothetical protein [Candidatus Scalindua sp.]